MKRLLLLLAFCAVLVVSCKKENATRDASSFATLSDETIINGGDTCVALYSEKSEAAKETLARGHQNQSAGPFVIWVNFNGSWVTSAAWTQFNGGQSYYAPPSGLSSLQRKKIIDIMKEDYAPYLNYVITEDKVVFNNAAPGRRHEHVVTSNISSFLGIYGGASGIAHYFSAFWADGTQSFTQVAFTGGTPGSIEHQRNMGHTLSHETNHAFGLYHHARYDPAGNYLGEYEWAINAGSFLSFAKLMGGYANSTYVYQATGRIPEYLGGGMQNDFETLGATLGLKPDEVGDDFSAAYDIMSKKKMPCFLQYDDVQNVYFIKKQSKNVELTVTSKGSVYPILYLYKKTGPNKYSLVDSVFSVASLTFKKTIPKNTADYYAVLKRKHAEIRDDFGQPLNPFFGAGNLNCSYVLK